MAEIFNKTYITGGTICSQTSSVGSLAIKMAYAPLPKRKEENKK